MKTGLAVIAAVILVCGQAKGQVYDMAYGHAVVDGVVGEHEWSGANWIRADKNYLGTHPLPVDMTNAMWAALWDEADNAIYVVVTLEDSDPVHRPYGSWNTQDDVELYINSPNDDVEDFNAVGAEQFGRAQQYTTGLDAATTSKWVVIGGGESMPEGTLPECTVAADGSRMTYEFRIRPFEMYVMTNVEASTEIDLHAGLVVGLDIAVVSTTSGPDPSYGMVCENTMGGKYRDAGQFRDHRLMAPPAVRGTIVTLR